MNQKLIEERDKNNELSLKLAEIQSVLVKKEAELKEKSVSEPGQTLSERQSDSVFRGLNGYFYEIIVSTERIELVSRRALEEEEHFIFWYGSKQFCAELLNTFYISSEWSISVKQYNDLLEKRLFPALSESEDTFIKKNKQIYFSSQKNNKFYLVKLNKDSVDFRLLGSIKAKITAIAVREWHIYTGLATGLVKCFVRGSVKHVLTMSARVTDMKVENLELSIIDSNGLFVVLNLASKTETMRVNLDKTGFYFFSGSSLVLLTETQIFATTALNPLFSNPIGNDVTLVENNKRFALLTSQSSSLLWFHSTQTYKYCKNMPLHPVYQI